MTDQQTPTLPARVPVSTALVRLGAGERLRIFGRCPERGCKTRRVLEVARVTEVGTKYGNAVDEHSLARLPEIAGWTAWVGTASLLGPAWPGSENPLYDEIVCPEHGFLKFAGLRATRLTTTACDAVCARSTSADCSCSCGGANHGTAA